MWWYYDADNDNHYYHHFLISLIWPLVRLGLWVILGLISPISEYQKKFGWRSSVCLIFITIKFPVCIPYSKCSIIKMAIQVLTVIKLLAHTFFSLVPNSAGSSSSRIQSFLFYYYYYSRFHHWMDFLLILGAISIWNFFLYYLMVFSEFFLPLFYFYCFTNYYCI